MKLKQFCAAVGKGLLALALIPVVNFSSAANAAAESAKGPAQLFVCNNGTTASFRNITSHDKQFQLGNNLGKVAVLVDDGQDSSASCGMNVVPTRAPFSFISWYYNDGRAGTLKNVTVRYCFSKKDGTPLPTVDIQGGNGNRGGSVGNGWSVVVQDNRVFPSEVSSGNAYLDRVCFIFSGKGSPANITLGDVQVTTTQAPSYIGSLNTTLGDCSLASPCLLLQ
ncbi:MAG TPA: hypothetical protein V6C89_13285 [Drouetiella sp.]|jgi:hypothetical protein